MKRIHFHKYHGLGNDFLIIDLIKQNTQIQNFNDFAEKICNRNFGVGADGIMVLTKSRKTDCCIDIFNSDGSWAEKCGNGLRTVAAYYYENYARRKKLTFEFNKVLTEAKIIKFNKSQCLSEVSLGKPELETNLIPMKSKTKYHINTPIIVDGTKFPVTVLSVGNPHTVMFVKNFDFNWQELGKIIENHDIFPHRTNVEFAKIVSKSRIILNDWERGAGATGSSGTGAAASVVAGVINGYVNRKAEVVFPAGSLFINWNEDTEILLTGPTEYVCNGDYYYKPK